MNPYKLSNRVKNTMNKQETPKQTETVQVKIIGNVWDGDGCIQGETLFLPKEEAKRLYLLNEADYINPEDIPCEREAPFKPENPNNENNLRRMITYDFSDGSQVCTFTRMTQEEYYKENSRRLERALERYKKFPVNPYKNIPMI